MDQASETSEQHTSVEEMPRLTEQNVDNNLVQTILKEINSAQSAQSAENNKMPNLNQQPSTHHQPSFQQIPSNIQFQVPNEMHADIPRDYQHELPKQGYPMNLGSHDYSNPQFNMNPYLYNQKMMEIINNEETIFNKLTKHLKETFIVLFLFILLSCETTRSACATNIPKLGNSDKTLNMFGTILLSIIYGIVFICIKQFM